MGRLPHGDHGTGHTRSGRTHRPGRPDKIPQSAVCQQSAPESRLRHVLHPVIATHNGQIDPQRHLNVRMAKPLADHVERDPTCNQPMPRRTVAQAVSASTPLTRTGRLLVETSPLDTISNVPQRRPHRQRHHLVPRRPVGRPVREKPHQVPMQPHRTGPPALRPPHQQRCRLAQVVEIPPFDFENLGTRRPVRHMMSAAVRAWCRLWDASASSRRWTWSAVQ